MSLESAVIAAFSEDQAVRLTGLSKGRLRYWDRTGFYHPSYADENRRLSFSRVYSFKDIVALRVLNTLRAQCGVSLQHLREISGKLSQTQEDRWTGVRLWVHDKRVVWEDPINGQPQEVKTGQYLVRVCLGLDEAVNATKAAVADFVRPRESTDLGRIERRRHVAQSRPVLAGTRIPVSAIKKFDTAGYSIVQILAEYPSLTEADVKAALAYTEDSAAA